MCKKHITYNKIPESVSPLLEKMQVPNWFQTSKLQVIIPIGFRPIGAVFAGFRPIGTPIPGKIAPSGRCGAHEKKTNERGMPAEHTFVTM